MRDAFDDIDDPQVGFGGLAHTAPKRFVPHVEADPSEPSPFGTAKPENLPPPIPRDGLTPVRPKGAKASPIRDHYPRVVRLCEGRFGGFFYPCDSKKVGRGGMGLVSTDLLGFMDIQGVTPGGPVGVNVTSRAGIAAHLRAYTNRAKTVGNVNRAVPVEDHLRRWMLYGRVFVFGYEKVGSRWSYEVVEVTTELLDEYKSRKRGAK